MARQIEAPYGSGPPVQGQRLRIYAPAHERDQGNGVPQADANAYAGSSRGGLPFEGGPHPNARRPTESAGPWTPPENAFDGRWIRDRYARWTTGYEISGRDSGLCDPQLSGPPRPSLQTINRSWMLWQGSDATRNYDPARPSYKAYGTQDGSNTRIWGGQQGYSRPYGATVDFNHPEPAQPGPSVILGGAPHGLHTHTAPNKKETEATYRGTPQMRRPRQDRLANSQRSGQSYSALTRHQGGVS